MKDIEKQFPDRKIVGRFDDPIPQAKREGATWMKKQNKAKVQQLIDMWRIRCKGDVAFKIPDEAFLELETLTKHL